MVLDYPCPPGHGIDVIGLMWIVRIFGPATRDRWPTDRGLRVEDFPVPYRAAFDDLVTVLQGLGPDELRDFQMAGGLPEGWPAPDAVERLWFALGQWHADFYPVAVQEPALTLRHRTFALAVRCVQDEGRLPQPFDFVSAAKAFEKKGQRLGRAIPDKVSPGDVYTLVAHQPFGANEDRESPIRLPPGSGELSLQLRTLLDRLRDRTKRPVDADVDGLLEPNQRRRDASELRRSASAADSESAAESAGRHELEDKMEAAVTELRARGPTFDAAIEYLLGGVSRAEVAECHHVTVKQMRAAEAKVIARLREVGIPS